MSESVSDPVYPRSPTSEKKIAKISNNERVVSVNSDDKMKVKNSAFHYHRQIHILILENHLDSNLTFHSYDIY